MKKMAFLASMLLVLTGCKYTINGAFNVNEDIRLGSKEYRAGSYTANVALGKTTFSKRYKLTMKVETAEGENSHTFKAPKGTTIPENGSVNFTASELKQPYGLNGVVSTVYTDDNQRRRGYESCTYSVPYTVCYPNGRYGQTCHTEYRQVMGNRQVEYFMRTKDQDLSFNLVDGQRAVANFDGSYNNTYRVYTYQGTCR